MRLRILSRALALLSFPAAVVLGWLQGPSPASGQLFKPPPKPAPPAPAPSPPANNLALEQRLTELHFDVGPPDGVLDEASSHGIMAFQKVYDLPRTGQLDEQFLLTVGRPLNPPAPIIPGGEPDRVEIDLHRQTLYLYQGGKLNKILPVSTGNGERFCSEGYCRNAVTPTGAFRIYRQGTDWERGPLGDLYKPQYFEGGVAIHGAKSVPGGPASHGCVRIPMHSAEWFAGAVTVGTPVYVAG